MKMSDLEPRRQQAEAVVSGAGQVAAGGGDRQSHTTVRPSAVCGAQHSEACAEVRKAIEVASKAGVSFDADRATVCSRMLCELALNADPWPLHISRAVIDGALKFQLMDCKRPLSLVDCDVQGDVDWRQASIRAASIEGGSIRGDISASQLHCQAMLRLAKVSVEGIIDLRGATISGDLHCEGTHVGLAGQSSEAGFLADGLQCQGSLLLGTSENGKDGKRTFVAATGIRLVGARVGGTVDLRSAAVGIPEQSPSAFAISETELDLVRTTECEAHKPIDALCADLIKCEGSILLDDLVAHGHVRFLGAVVRGQILATGTQVKGWFLGAALYCTDIVRFHAVTAGGGLSFAGARVDQRLEVSGSSEGKVAALRLNGARVGNFVDDEKSRPPAGELMLDGFVYDTIGDRNFGRDGEEEQEWFARMEWIHRQSNSSPKLHWYDWTRGSDYPYKPGPYTVFADFLDRRGRPNLAGKTRIERETRRARRKQLPRHRRLRLLLLWSVSRFGYEPERALYWLAAMPVLALCLDWLAAVRGPEWPAYWIVVDAIRTYATAAKNIVPLTNSHSKSFTEVLVTVLTVAILSVGGAGALRILARK